MGDNMNDDNNDDNKDNKADDQLDEFEEEFEFETDEEDALAPEFEIEDEESEPATKKPRKNMLLPIVIAVAIVGFIGWKVVDMFSEPEVPKPTSTTPAPKIEKPAPTPPVEKAVPQSTLPSMIDAQNVIPQEVTATEASLTKLQKKLEDQDNALKQRISTLEKELATANQNAAQANAGMNKMQNDLAALNATVQGLTNQLRAFYEEREKQQAKAASKKAAAPHKIEGANPTLSVYAIIPGRAWLRSTSGKTITVSEGDNVGEYGKVIKIDAGNGVVITSSGVTLR